MGNGEGVIVAVGSGEAGVVGEGVAVAEGLTDGVAVGFAVGFGVAVGATVGAAVGAGVAAGVAAQITFSELDVKSTDSLVVKSYKDDIA